jgi:hypothetical protein
MLKAENVKECMSNHIISSKNEANEAIQFVIELLESEMDDIQQNNPYATKTLEHMTTTIDILNNLVYELEDIEEEEL